MTPHYQIEPGSPTVAAVYFSLTAEETALVEAAASETRTKPSTWMKLAALDAARAAVEARTEKADRQ